MKKILLIMICSMAAFATSCSLEETPYSITSEKLGQTEEGAEQLVTGIYATFWDNWCMNRRIWPGWTTTTIIVGLQLGYSVLQVAAISPDTMPIIQTMICGVSFIE